MKDTLKTLSLLEENIERLIENGIYEIERDLLLERLRGLYASVVATDAVAEEDRVLDALLSVGVALPEEALEPEIEVERFFAEPEEEAETTEEPVEEEPVEEEVAEEPAPEPIEEETAPEIVEEEVEEEVVPEPEEVAEPEVEPTPEPAVEEEIDHAAVLSLYDDDDDDEEETAEEEEVEVEEETPVPEQLESEEEVTEPEAEETPEENVLEEYDELEEVAEEEPKVVVLGDILSSEQTTVADHLAEQLATNVAEVAGSTLSLRESIGVNDKYILLRDLFASDSDYYDRAISTLDTFESLDEAMLYIYDNYHWNPNCEGARLLMELLARKLY